MSNEESPLSTQAEPAPPPARPPAARFRRLLASAFDMSLALATSFVAVGLVGLAIPPEGPESLLVAIGLALLAALAAVVGPCVASGRTAGKWLLSLQVVPDASDRELAARRRLARLAVTYSLWPINALIVLVRADRRHLGDTLCGTRVVLDERRRDAQAAILGPSVVGFAFLVLVPFSMKISVMNTSAWQAAQVSLAEGGAVPTWPTYFVIEDNIARFYVKRDGSFVVVELARRDGIWNVASTRALVSSKVPSSREVTFSPGAEDKLRERLEVRIESLLADQVGKRYMVRCPDGGLLGDFECTLETPMGEFPVDVTHTSENLSFETRGVGFGKLIEDYVYRVYADDEQVSPEGVDCPDLTRLAKVVGVQCAARVAGVPVQVMVGVDGNKEDVTEARIPNVFSGETLEKLARRHAAESGQGDLEFQCLEEVYVLNEGDKVACMSAGKKVYVAKLTRTEDGLHVVVERR